MKLILASKSPRRKDILEKHGYEFTVQTAEFKEINKDLSPAEIAVYNAYGKAKATFDRLKDKNAVVLGADTIVCLDGKILGKPKDEKDAKLMLRSLSGRSHVVITGYAIIAENKEIKNYTESTVTFLDLSDNLIGEYVNSRLPLDKAGSYGIQDGYPLVKEYSGSFNNIVGLPIEDIKPTLDELLK